MKVKIIVVVIVLLLLGGGLGFYFYYNSVLRFTDDFTDCPVAGFRSSATSVDAATGWVTEESMGSLKITERCSLDCLHGNHMACVLYGLAQQKGVPLMKDLEGSGETLQKACDRGETLGCDLVSRAVTMATAAEKAKAVEAARAASKEVTDAINKRKGEIGHVINAALGHFNGNSGPMKTGGMMKWYTGTVKYLLFDTPLLSQMHQVPGSKIEKSGLKDFVLAKYMGGSQKPDFSLTNKFFQKLMRLGVQQIKLDYHVEKKRESKIPRNSGYFRAKHTFLYNVAQVEMEILDVLLKDIEYEINEAG